MISFTPFRAGHLNYLRPQPEQEAEYRAVMAAGTGTLIEGPLALSAWAEMRCIGAAGCLHVTPYRAVGWMILSGDAAPYMLPIARKVRRVFGACSYKRIELTVAAQFESGHRFARLLGAVQETPEPMRFYGMNGQAEIMYALVKD